MPSPFPGMDPYLEHPDLWPGLHLHLTVKMADLLSPQLYPKYFVSLQVRMYEEKDIESLFVDIPDVSVLSKKSQINTSNYTESQVAIIEPSTKPITVTLPIPITIRQGYLEIQEVATKEVVTTIEILSPSNKKGGKGREIYLEKREKILDSLTNFIEIDLLRRGQRMPISNHKNKSHYQILVSRVKQRPRADLYAFNIQNKIPEFPLPLRPEDTEPIIDLQALLTNIYDVGSYDLKIDYTQKPVPKLSENDATWADTWLRQEGIR
ncbi:MAG: DUF4058 family protein [Okeania sp. SIO3B5]|uniref:DUF4058 family protein n=1 Tax=Okeania sp. SIO3B5 TaxID=2607811 RepID=UPI0014007D9C|nr:DUF4058 family protein [Okeania sp. SIO3B5]NEO51856.1 DUF4058 family protein [Okeania sp. SIO3B5]